MYIITRIGGFWISNGQYFQNTDIRYIDVKISVIDGFDKLREKLNFSTSKTILFSLSSLYFYVYSHCSRYNLCNIILMNNLFISK